MTQLAFETLLIDQPADHVLRISFNRPARMNAISNLLEQELDDALVAADLDPTVRAVILTGGGETFCFGYEMADPEVEPPELAVAGPGPYLEWWHAREEKHRQALLRIWDLSKPVVAAVNGAAIAGGAEYAMICDVTLAGEAATFGEPQLRHSSSPPTLIMPWIVGWKQAKRLLLTGDTIGAQEAYRIGLVTAVVPDAELQDQAVKLAERMAHVPRLSMKWNKLAINRSVEQMGLREALNVNTLLTIFAHAAFGRGEGNREELKAALKRAGLVGYLQARDRWFDEQLEELKV